MSSPTPKQVNAALRFYANSSSHNKPRHENDASGTGQAAEWSLAKRLIGTGIECEVRIPDRTGADWADELTA